MTNEKELKEKLEVMLPRTKAGNDMLKAIISMAKQRGKEEQGLVKIKDVRFDMAEILNNLNDDLKVDKDEAEEFYKTTNLNEARLNAVKKYTLKIVKEKYKKYGGKD